MLVIDEGWDRRCAWVKGGIGGVGCKGEESERGNVGWCDGGVWWVEVKGIMGVIINRV